jgi:hypothetical protein
MRRSVVLGVIIFGATLAAIATSRRGTADPASPAAAGEAITGAPAVSATGSATPRHDPFTGYDVGPPEAITPYDGLPAGERAVVDRGRDTTRWKPTHDGFAAASADRAHAAVGDAAQLQLGIDQLATTGVVP